MSIIQRYTYKSPNVVFGGQDVIGLEYLALPFQMTIAVDVVAGSINYGIEYTVDDLMGDPAEFRWFIDDEMLPTGLTDTGVYVLTTPITGMRLNIMSMDGEVRLTVIQPVGVGY